MTDHDKIIDPTENVIALVKAETKRIDDLREAEAKRVDALRLAESQRVNEVMQLRADHNKELIEKESKRMDAIRAVDVAAVAVANDKSVASAALLANAVQTTAETLRSLVAATATQVAESLTRLSEALTERIAKLEVSQSKSEGRQGLSTPIIIALSTVAGGMLGYLIQQLFKLGAIK